MTMSEYIYSIDAKQSRRLPGRPGFLWMLMPHFQLHQLQHLNDPVGCWMQSDDISSVSASP